MFLFVAHLRGNTRDERGKMVDCPVCKVHVSYMLLRTDHPKCPNDHELGTWMRCSGNPESHVFLENNQDDGPTIKGCPYCGSAVGSQVKEGTRVKCLHVTSAGSQCNTRPYDWIKEGPPCFMNHLDKIVVFIAPTEPV